MMKTPMRTCRTMTLTSLMIETILQSYKFQNTPFTMTAKYVLKPWMSPRAGADLQASPMTPEPQSAACAQPQ